MTLIKFYPGDGTTQMVDVEYVADYPRSPYDKGLNTCAFCLGDPCAEDNPPVDSHIAQYYARNPHAATCPMCDGRPS